MLVLVSRTGMVGLHSLGSVVFGIDFILQQEPLTSLHELIAMNVLKVKFQLLF